MHKLELYLNIREFYSFNPSWAYELWYRGQTRLRMVPEKVLLLSNIVLSVLWVFVLKVTIKCHTTQSA